MPGSVRPAWGGEGKRALALFPSMTRIAIVCRRVRRWICLRSLITWMGGPPGHINSNPEQAIESLNCAVGLMDMPVGNRQPGVHTHTMTEIYIILERLC